MQVSIEGLKIEFSDAAIGMALVSLDHSILDANTAFCNMLGYSQNELVDILFKDVTCPNDVESSLDIHNQLINSELDKYQLEKCFLHKQGHEVWGSIDLSLVRDEDATPLYAIAQIQDITDRKELEKQLNQLQRMETLKPNIGEIAHDALKGIGLGVIVIDRNRNILYSNQIAREICADNKAYFDAETRFCCRQPEIESWLIKNIEDITENINENDINFSSSSISVKRSSSKTPLLLMLSRDRRELLKVDANKDKEPLFIIYLSDPSRDINVPTEMCKNLYGLSAAEVKVLHYIVNGMTVIELAEHISVSVAAIRKHLHNIFKKTNTNNQTELMRLVLLNSVCFSTISSISN